MLLNVSQMEISIISNFLFFIWIEIFPSMFNQNGNLNVLVSFLSLENNTECTCVKPTLNRYLVLRSSLCNVVQISWFILKQTSFFIWSEISQLYLLFWCKTLKIFCHWKMIKNIYEINQHWTGNYPMKCFLNKLIYIKTLS